MTATPRVDRALLTIGCLLYAGSAPLLLLLSLLIMSSLPGGAPDEGTWDWWSAVLRTMFRPNDAGPVTTVLLVGSACGLILITRGLWQSLGPFRITTGTMMIIVVIAAFGFAYVPIGILFLLFAPVVLTLVVLLRRPVPSRRLAERDEEGSVR